MPFAPGNRHQRRASDPIARFWSKVDRSGGPGACWPYLGAKVWDGYGRYRLPDRTVRAHRYAFEITRGPIPAGQQLDHLCSNRPCCNPAHLEPVALAENVRRGDHRGPFRTTPYIRPRAVTP